MTTTTPSARRGRDDAPDQGTPVFGSKALAQLRASRAAAPTAPPQPEPDPVVIKAGELPAKFQALLDEADQPATGGSSASHYLAKRRAQLAAKEAGKFVDEPGFEQLAPAERVAYEERRLAELHKIALASRDKVDGTQLSLQRVAGQHTAEEARSEAYDTACTAAAVAGTPLPDAAPSKLPALQRAKLEIEAQRTKAIEVYTDDATVARNTSRLFAAQRALALHNANALVGEKLAPVITELRTLLANTSGTHVFRFDGGATLSVDIAAIEQPAPPPVHVSSYSLAKLRAARAAASQNGDAA